MKLVATKSFSYSTRRLKPGDVFEAKDPDGRLLVGVRKARYFGERKESFVPAPKKETLDRLLSTTVTSEVKKPATTTVVEEVIENEAGPKGNEGGPGVNGADASQISTTEDSEAEEAPEKKVEEVPEAAVEKTPVKPVNRRGRARKN